MNTYEELYHFGVKGMKWGVRKDDRQNPNYKSKHRLADQKMYSKGAVKRINKNMNEGLGLKAARSLEADRINNYRKKAIVNRRRGGMVGKILGGILGGASAGISVLSLRSYTEKRGTNKIVYSMLHNPMIAGSIVGGGAKLGMDLGSDFGRAIGEKGTMRAGGYDPKKLRD